MCLNNDCITLCDKAKTDIDLNATFLDSSSVGTLENLSVNYVLILNVKHQVFSTEPLQKRGAHKGLAW